VDSGSPFAAGRTLADMSDVAAAVTAGAAALSCAVGGAVVPAVVGALPRPRDLGPTDPGPDYRKLSRRPGLRSGSVVVGGLVGSALGLRLGSDPVLPALCFLTVIGLVLSYVDVHERRLPDAVVGPGALVLGALLVLAAVLRHDPYPLVRAGIGAALSAGLLGSAVLVRPDGLGLGDVKLVGLTGAVLGWLSWSTILLGLLAGLTLGGLFGLILIAARRASRRTAIPLGPALLAGALLVVLLHGP
jgi:leader peptidase (prepilin peptidase)/N-methyltransferase